jgi:hypothetical protein
LFTKWDAWVTHLKRANQFNFGSAGMHDKRCVIAFHAGVLPIPVIGI